MHLQDGIMEVDKMKSQQLIIQWNGRVNNSNLEKSLKEAINDIKDALEENGSEVIE